MKRSRSDFDRKGQAIERQVLCRRYVTAAFAAGSLPDFYENVLWPWNLFPAG